MNDVNVEVTVTVNGRRVTPEVPPRRRGSGGAHLHEFTSADDLSWMGVTTRKGIHGDPYVYLDVELQAKETPDGPWVPDVGADKYVEIEGELTDGLGQRWTVGGGTAVVPPDEHTYDLTILMGGKQSPPVRLQLWTVRKTGGYWGGAGPNSHRCDGTIDQMLR